MIAGSHGHGDRILRAAGVVELAVAAGIACFWVAFIAGVRVDFPDPAGQLAYDAFESAFPAPDAVLTLALATGGLGLLRRARYGPPLSLAAAGALVFLGLLDAAFNAKHGVYRLMPAQFLVNAACIGLGVWIAASVWRHGPAGAGPRDSGASGSPSPTRSG